MDGSIVWATQLNTSANPCPCFLQFIIAQEDSPIRTMRFLQNLQLESIFASHESEMTID